MSAFTRWFTVNKIHVNNYLQEKEPNFTSDIWWIHLFVYEYIINYS